MSGVQISDLMPGCDNFVTSSCMWNYSNHGTVQQLSNTLLDGFFVSVPVIINNIFFLNPSA